jgi:hypothetical protein
MFHQNMFKNGFGLGPVVEARKFLADRRNQFVRLFPAFLFRDLQYVTEVALDSGFNRLVPLYVLQVPGAESHQGSRRQHNGQLQRQERSRAVRQSPFLEHSGPRPVADSFLPGQDYKRLPKRMCQAKANDCKKL